MKKTITFLSKRAAMMLLATLLLTMTAQTAWATTPSAITVGGTDYTLFTGFTATRGNGTGYAKLVDGNTSTDWSAWKSDGEETHDFNGVRKTPHLWSSTPMSLSFRRATS